MFSRYGLITPNKAQPLTKKPSIFDEDSDSETEAPVVPKKSLKRQDRVIQQKAVEEDPTVYQYDELYDDMQEKRKESKLSRKDLDKKPKYIGKLLQTAERRKRENERRIERQVQKERELEGEQFKDKESFVTSAYKKKLEELKELEEQEKREEYLESIGDVKKQGNLDGFYRHLYDQKVNYEEKEIKEGKVEKTRNYRKRLSSGSEQEEKEDEEAEIKLEHLPSNLDADSDFSIDSSDSDDDEEKETKKEQTPPPVVVVETKAEQVAVVEKIKEESKEAAEETKEEVVSKPKKPKIDIWKKRTVGEVFDEAVKRYFERKALREGSV